MDEEMQSHVRLSVDKDSTVHDIWQYTQQQQGAKFDANMMNKAVDMQRQVRKESQSRPSERFSLGKLLDCDSPVVRQDEVSRAMRRRSTNINLQKSLALLDDAVGTPVPLLRSIKKAKHPSALRRAMTPSQTTSMDLSTSALPASMNATLGTTFHNDTSIGGASQTADRSSVLAHSMLDDEMKDGLLSSSVAMLLDDDPALAASDSIFTDFTSQLCSHTAEQQVFELISEYESTCNAQVTAIQKLLQRVAPAHTKYNKVKATLNQLNGEMKTWRLIGLLYRDRLEKEQHIDVNIEESMMVESFDKNVSDKTIVTTLYEKEASIRQAQLVVDWLEKNSEEKLGSYYDRVEFFSNQTSSWENTLHNLQAVGEGVPYRSDRMFCQKLDPDAPIRSGQPLADLDQEDELRLLTFVFACIRAGQLDEAQKLCSRCGQSWRAATLEGWRLYHDPNYDDNASLEPVAGNPYRDIWKVACWRLAEDERFPLVERAIYASLSGNLKALLPACSTWSDQLWAYIRCMVDTRVEQEIRIQTTAERTPEQLPANYWDKPMSMDSIFRELQASPYDNIKSESRQKFETVQKYIILGDIDALLEEIYEWCKDDGQRPSPHLTRFLAHLILFLRAIGLSAKEEVCIVVLETYIATLIEAKRNELVATYVSKLPQPLQVEWYAKFLEGITETSARYESLSLAQEAGLDVAAITKRVVENIRTYNRPEFTIDTELPIDTAISVEDQQKIDAIEWLVFNPSQRSEAIRQANAVMRTFLALKKQSAAQAVFNKIPSGSIDVIIKNWQMQTGSTELSAEDDNTIREYLCIQAFLDAQDSFNDWFDHYHKAKPSSPPAATGPTFTERVAYEHKEKQYQAELERWQHSLMLQSKTTVDKIYNVLLFVDGGWMVDQRKEACVDESRALQMSRLRSMCLPALCLLLHSVLHCTGQYQKCMQLADIMASEQHQLYTIFSHDELCRFLQKLQESSVELLNKDLDPLGYPL